MNLTQSELGVVNSATRANITSPGIASADEHRTFHDIDATSLDTLMSKHSEYLGNEGIDRLPATSAFQSFLSEYPCFRVHGFFHNLTVEKPVQMFVTGIEYVPKGDESLDRYTEDEMRELKRRFTSAFYAADYLHVSEGEIAAEFHIDRLFETA